MRNDILICREYPGYRIVSLKDGPDFSDSCVLAVGNFDGVHAAHRELLKQALSLKNKINAKTAGAWSFCQNPLEFLSESPPPYIYDTRKKTAELLRCGMDFVVLCDFKVFGNMSADDFIKSHLKNQLRCTGVVCGFNFTFGRGGTGKPCTLQNHFGADNTVIVPEIKINGTTVSSTAIREMIMNGDTENAALFLTRPYSLTSKVLTGKKLGRKLGFPTVNQCFKEGCVVPRFGIYSSVCTLENGEKHIGVSNIGVRPTITDGSDSHAVNCETFIDNFNQDIYGQIIKTEFYSFLRSEKKFADVEKLKEAIKNDAQNAKNYFIKKQISF